MKPGWTAGRARVGAAAVAALTAILPAIGPSTAGAATSSGLSVVTSACGTNKAGSSDSTEYPSNHRAVVTNQGRTIVVYDTHGEGQQLSWRANGGSWQNKSTGAASDGYFPEQGFNNDRPASLALGVAGSQQHAWWVWAGYGDSSSPPLVNLPVKLRRLSDLDSPGGPSVGGSVEVAPAELGNLRPDVAIYEGAVHVVWVRHSTSGYDLVTAASSDLGSDSPGFPAPTVLPVNANASTTATFVRTSQGLRLVVHSGDLEVFRLEGSNWVGAGADGVAASPEAQPSAVTLPSGDILAAVGSGAGVEVVRFASNGTHPEVELVAGGHKQPSLAANGGEAWLVMLNAHGDLVSRRRDAQTGWTSSDHVEITNAEGEGDLAWPNAVSELGGRLRVLVDGPRCNGRRFRNWVLFLERGIGAPAGGGKITTHTRVAVGRAGRVNASGTVRPSQSGRRATVTFLRRKSGRYVSIARRRPLLSKKAGHPGVSKYSTSFARPSWGSCRVKVELKATSTHRASSARRTFSC